MLSPREGLLRREHEYHAKQLTLLTAATMSDYSETHPQARFLHPTIRMGLIAPFALIDPIHSPTLTPAGGLLKVYNSMDVFDAASSTLDHPPV